MISYAISDPSTLCFDHLDQDLERFSQQADMILYRDKKSDHYPHNAKTFLKRASNYPFDKILLHSDYQLAKRLGADGVHLTSTQFDAIESAKALGLFVIISCHSYDEVITAQKYGADMVTFSPIFATPNKGEPLGVAALYRLTLEISIPIIALGGILTQEHIEQCQIHGASGFASIRYFQRH